MSGSNVPVALAMFTPDVLANVTKDANNLYLNMASGEQVVLSIAALKGSNHSKNNNSARTVFAAPVDNSSIAYADISNVSATFTCSDSDGKIMGASYKLDDGDYTDLGVANVASFTKTIALANIMPGGHRFYVKLIDDQGFETTHSVAWYNMGSDE